MSGALTLVLNTAEKRVQFLLCREGDILCAEDWLARRGGTELLAPALDRACAALGAEPSAIARVACVAGPGGFTGLRLGLATASALARANNAALAGLDYLECLAASVPAAPGERLLVAVLARQGWAYSGVCRAREDGPPRLEGGIALMSLTETPVSAPAGIAYALGSGLSAARDHFGRFLPCARLLPPAFDQPSPAALLAVANAASFGAERDIAPRYLRDCDAVENLGDIAARRGLDPQAAHARLNALLQR